MAKGHCIAKKSLCALQFGIVWLVITLIYDTFLFTLVVVALTSNDHMGAIMRVPFSQSCSLFLLAAGIGIVIFGWIFRIVLENQLGNEGIVQ